MTANAYYDTFCGPEATYAPCTAPVGVVYLAPFDLLVLTEANWTWAGQVPTGPSAVVEFNPVTLLPVARLNLSCTPGFPYYPGTGSDLFVPCGGPILVVSVPADREVGSISLPFEVVSMTFDTQNGYFYTGGWNSSGTMEVGGINLQTMAPADLFLVPGGTFIGSYDVGGAYLLAYDPAANALLMPNVSSDNDASGTSLLGLDPETGAAALVAAIGGPILSIAVSPTSDQILTTTDVPYSVDVLNAQSYAQEARVTLPTCFPGVCAGGDAQDVLIDPGHGDAYLLTSLALDVLNLSTLSIVSSTFDYGYGTQGSGAYVPGVDRVFGTYNLILEEIPGFMIQLDHGSYEVLSSLLWLPTAEAILGLGTGLGAVLAVFRGLGPPVPPRVKDPPRPWMRAPPTETDERFWPYGDPNLRR